METTKIDTSQVEETVKQIVDLLQGSVDHRQFISYLMGLKEKLKTAKDPEYRERVLRRLNHTTGGFSSLSDGIFTPHSNSKIGKEELNRKLDLLTTALFNETKLLISKSRNMDFPRKKDRITELLDQIISLLKEAKPGDIINRTIRGLEGQKESMETILDQEDEKRVLDRIRFGLESKAGRVPLLNQIHLINKIDNSLTEEEMNKKLKKLTEKLSSEVKKRLLKNAP